MPASAAARGAEPQAAPGSDEPPTAREEGVAEAREAPVPEPPEATGALAEPSEEEPAPVRRPGPVSTGDLLAEISQRAQPGERPAGAEEIDDLQHLIDELQSARIEPSPEMDDLPPPELDQDIEDMVSETLARIYAAQSQYGEAANVYAQLARQQPDRAEEFEEKAAEMRQKAAQEE